MEHNGMFLTNASDLFLQFKIQWKKFENERFSEKLVKSRMKDNPILTRTNFFTI